MNRVFVALGSNLEPRAEYLRSAVRLLRTIGEVVRVSAVYETAPVGEVAQPDYLNAVVEIATLLEPMELLSTLKEFEVSLGRKERPRWHEREVDFDIVFYDHIVLVSPELTIPHPELHRRAFVLAPMADLDAKFVHPLLHETVEELLTATDATGLRQSSIELC